MKKIISLLCVFGVFFYFQSCNDLLDFNFDATFATQMQIDVVETKSDLFSFSDSALVNIEDDEDIKKHFDKIKELEITQIDLTLTGIPVGALIHQLYIEVENINLLITLSDIDENYTLSLPVEAAMLNALSAYLLEHRQTEVKAYGTSSYAPMTLGVNLTYTSKVNAAL